MDEWDNFNINQHIIANLERCNFTSPTEIQRKVLVYTGAKVDLIIQARTGEGKTLCYGIPIVNYILNFYMRAEEKIRQISPVALILVPTRELGIQVKKHIENILIESHENEKMYLYNIKIANVLGGFAKPKQLKILNKYNPEIIIATPGRLWEIIENEESSFIEKLHKLRFLVIDEADRMTEKGHFSELKKIVEHVYNKIEINNSGINLIHHDKIMSEGAKDNKSDMLENELIAKSLRSKGKGNINLSKIETIDPMSLLPEEGIINNLEQDPQGSSVSKDNDKEILDKKMIKQLKRGDISCETNIQLQQKVPLRTILCSATIESVHKFDTTKKGNKSKRCDDDNNNNTKTNLHNLIKSLKFFNKLIYIKLHQENEDSLLNEHNTEDTSSSSNILPEKLTVECYKCESSIKDYYLFHILKENDKKKIIIFTNSISHTKKIYSIFSYFNEFKSICLHSKMLQNVRIKNLENFANNEHTILFCTDIGARGLDIPHVDLVIHYHIPKTTELFIHRSGRTARANKEGKVVSLISEQELVLYKKIMIDLKFQNFSMKTLNVVQLEKYKSVFEYAKEVEKETYTIKKANREKQWYEKTSKDCDMIYDEIDNNPDEDEEYMASKKLLNRKRGIITKQRFKEKKIYTRISSNNIKRTSFLTPDMVKKLNSLVEDKSLFKEKGLNLTQAIYEANSDARAFRYKEKPRKKRYQRRRKK